MITEFLLAIGAGIIVNIISWLIQRKMGSPEAAIHLRQRSESVVMHKTTIHIQDGPAFYEETQTEIHIIETTFDLPERLRIINDQRLPIAIGIVVFFVFLAVLLLA